MAENHQTTEHGETKGTEYRVFQVQGGPNDPIRMTEVDTVTATTDIKAIQAAVAEPDDGAEYVAIPLRNLRVRKIQVLSQPKIVVA